MNEEMSRSDSQFNDESFEVEPVRGPELTKMLGELNFYSAQIALRDNPGGRCESRGSHEYRGRRLDKG